MKLTDNDIGTFCKLWEKETGQSISANEAQKYAEELLYLVSTVMEEKPP